MCYEVKVSAKEDKIGEEINAELCKEIQMGETNPPLVNSSRKFPRRSFTVLIGTEMNYMRLTTTTKSSPKTYTRTKGSGRSTNTGRPSNTRPSRTSYKMPAEKVMNSMARLSILGLGTQYMRNQLS